MLNDTLGALRPRRAAPGRMLLTAWLSYLLFVGFLFPTTAAEEDGEHTEHQDTCTQEQNALGRCPAHALLQHRSSVRSSSAELSGTSPAAEEVVKFLAGVPVYNYGYVERLAQCKESNSRECELGLVQTGIGEEVSGPDSKKDKKNEKKNEKKHEKKNEKDNEKNDVKKKKSSHAQEWLVKMKDGISDQVINSFCWRLPGRASCIAQGHPSKGGIPLVVMQGTEDELEQQLRDHRGKCEYVEPDIPLDAIPELRSQEDEEDDKDKKKKDGKKKKKEKNEKNKPKNSTHAFSWGLDRIDSRHGLDGSFIIGHDGGKDVHIYVADTGIRTTHEDFEGRAIPTLEIREGIIHECEAKEKKCAKDENGHGTHAAAIVGGKKFGVAKSSKVHSVKILSDKGLGKMSYLIQALDWVATKGLRPAIFTASVGGLGTPPSVVKAIEAASVAGVTVIVAAGNNAEDACKYTPAHVKYAITVGATKDAKDHIAPYSNFGSCVDVFAPGSDIHSAGRSSNTANAMMSGTSMACPHVAGAAALLLGEDPTRVPEEIALLLKARATQTKIKGAPKGTPDLMLYAAKLHEGDIVFWQRIWFTSWWKLFRFTSWADLFRPGPMKELIAEALVCGLFLVALAFFMTRCFRYLTTRPGTHDPTGT